MDAGMVLPGHLVGSADNGDHRKATDLGDVETAVTHTRSG